MGGTGERPKPQDDGSDRGQPGGGKGRVVEVDGSPVYPGSGPYPRGEPPRSDRSMGVDLTLDQADSAEFDGLLIPTGFVNADLMRQSAGTRAFGASGKPIAGLRHGPWVLDSAGPPGEPAPDVLARPPRRPGEHRHHLARRAPRP